MKTNNSIKIGMLTMLAVIYSTTMWSLNDNKIENEKKLNEVNETTVEIQLIIPDNEPSGYLSRDPGIDNITNYKILCYINGLVHVVTVIRPFDVIRIFSPERKKCQGIIYQYGQTSYFIHVRTTSFYK